MGDLAFVLPKLSRSDLLLNNAQSSSEVLLQDIGNSYIYSLAQEPVDGISQLMDRSAIFALPHLHLISKPDEAEFGSVRWHAQQAAAAAGMMLPFLLLHKGVCNTSGRFMNGIEARLTGIPTAVPGVCFERGLISDRFRFKTVLDSTLSGALYDGLARPVDPDDKQFYQSRLKNAISGGLTFATLSAFACKTQLIMRKEAEKAGTLGLSKAGQTNANNLKAALIAGIPAGIVSAECRSLLDGKGPCSGSDLYKASYSFAFLGGALSSASASFHPHELRLLPARQALLNFQELRRAGCPSETVGIRWFNRIADDYFSDAEYKHLHRTIQKFESRARRNEISQNQINDTFNNLNRLLKGADARHSIGVQPRLCTNLVRETLENLAHPQNIDQGGHPTCVLNSMENIIASNHPEKYSKIIGDLALSGAHYYGDIGVKLPRRCLLPDAEAREAPRRDGSRCFASQLMQYYLANLHWSYGGELPDFSEAEAGTVKYQPIADGANRAALHVNGRILKEASEEKQGLSQMTPFEGPYILDHDIVPLFRRIIPRGKIQVIDHQKGIDKWTDENGRRTVQTFTKVEQLRSLLTDMHPNSTICGVRGEKLGGASGWHAVVLRDYDAATDTVYLDNSWGKGHEHSGRRGEKSRVPVDKLFKLMTPPDDGDKQ